MAVLTIKEKEILRVAVAQAEAQTGGEIVTAIIPESDDYASAELRFALVVGGLFFVLSLALSGNIEALWDRFLWGGPPFRLSLFSGIASALAGAAAYFLAQIPVIDRLLVGKKNMASAVRNRALRYFVESGVSNTVDRTGLLLFVSSLERRVELIADKGINEKVDPKTWEQIVSALIEGIKKGPVVPSLETAIAHCGAVLAEHVPPRKNDENELADGISEVEKGL